MILPLKLLCPEFGTLCQFSVYLKKDIYY